MFDYISFQREFRQERPVVIRNKDYTIFRSTLERMEEIIESGKLDQVTWEHVVGRIEEREKQSAKKKLRILTVAKMARRPANRSCV